jgi:enoyl-[acyl-carrier protein] reductase III
MIDLTGQVALVTGSSRGIGRETALRLAQAGADLVLNYVTSRGAAETLAESIASLGRHVLVVKADVSERDDVEEMMHAVNEHLGRLDIVVSNAASGGFRQLLDANDRHFEQTMNTNVRSLLYLVQQGMPLFERNPGRTRIIAISSHGSQRALPHYGLIGGSKAALESLARHLALELGGRGINVNIVQAGLVETDSTKRLPGSEFMFQSAVERSCVGQRSLQAGDVADAVLYLSSPLSNMVQGQTLTVDGGAAILA